MVAAGLLLSGCWHSGHHDTARPGFRSYAAWLEKGYLAFAPKLPRQARHFKHLAEGVHLL